MEADGEVVRPRRKNGEKQVSQQHYLQSCSSALTRMDQSMGRISQSSTPLAVVVVALGCSSQNSITSRIRLDLPLASRLRPIARSLRKLVANIKNREIGRKVRRGKAGAVERGIGPSLMSRVSIQLEHMQLLYINGNNMLHLTVYHRSEGRISLLWHPSCAFPKILTAQTKSRLEESSLPHC